MGVDWSGKIGHAFVRYVLDYSKLNIFSILLC